MKVSETPERIWVNHVNGVIGTRKPPKDWSTTEYIRADKAMQWNDNMDEAPRDGTGQLVGWTGSVGDFHYAIAFWSGYIWVMARTTIPCYPDVWMPLPEPPK